MPKIVPGCIFAIYSKEIHSEGLWYRVKVLKVKGDTAHIEYLDYGDTGQVPTSNLRSIPSRFLELPFQVFSLTLACFSFFHLWTYFLHCLKDDSVCCVMILVNRAIFVWPWNESARTKQTQPTNGNRAIWLVCRTDTNARGFWLVKPTLGWENFMPENFLEIKWCFALTSYWNTIGQSNDAFSILGFSLAGKRRAYVLIVSSIGW